MTVPTRQNSGNTSSEFEPGFEPVHMAAASSNEDSLGQLLQLLKKRGWLIVLITIIGLVCGIALYVVQTRKYTASSTIEVTEDMSSEFRVEATSSAMPGMSVDSQKIDTEIQILGSEALAQEVIRTLHLDSTPDFLRAKSGHKWDMNSPVDRTVLVGQFIKDLKVTRVGHTSLVQVNVTTRRPDLSALIANALVDKYIEHTFKDSYNSTQQVTVWLNGQLGDLKKNLENSQDHLLELQKEIGLVGSFGNTSQSDMIIAANLSELNKQLADAVATRMLKQAELNAVQSSTPTVVDAMSAGNKVIDSDKTNLDQLKSQYDSMAQTYGPSYFRLKALKAQIDQTQSDLNIEEHTQVALAQKELQAAQNNENLMRKALDEEEQNAFKNGSKAIQYELAFQEYQANRMLYDGLQVRLQEAGIMAGLRSSSVHIVNNAEIPAFPSSPQMLISVGGGIGAGLVLGVILAFLLEAMDTNLRTISEIENALQLPLLAAIPEVENENLRPTAFHQHVSSGNIGAWSKIGEALRSLRTSILLSRPGSPPQVLMVTSTRPAEGKTSIAVLESIIFALNGAKVLLIDADLRRPTIHLRLFGNKAEAHELGLSSVLTGKASLQEAVRPWSELPNLHILTSGPVPPLPSELLGSKQMVDMLAEARKNYDFVFVDTPPVLAVTDASVIGHLSDATFLVIRYGDARRHVVSRSVELLERSGANVMGVVVNVVDFRSAGYSEYYGKKYYEYYGERKEES